MPSFTETPKIATLPFLDLRTLPEAVQNEGYRIYKHPIVVGSVLGATIKIDLRKYGVAEEFPSGTITALLHNDADSYLIYRDAPVVLEANTALYIPRITEDLGDEYQLGDSALNDRVVRTSSSSLSTSPPGYYTSIWLAGGSVGFTNYLGLDYPLLIKRDLSDEVIYLGYQATKRHKNVNTGLFTPLIRTDRLVDFWQVSDETDKLIPTLTVELGVANIADYDAADYDAHGDYEEYGFLYFAIKNKL